jgi:hypothetical protein
MSFQLCKSKREIDRTLLVDNASTPESFSFIDSTKMATVISLLKDPTFFGLLAPVLESHEVEPRMSNVVLVIWSLVLKRSLPKNEAK